MPCVLAVRFTAVALRPCWTPRRRLLSLPRTSSGARETCGASLWGGLGRALDQVGLGHPPRQTEEVTPPALGLRSAEACCQRSSLAEPPGRPRRPAPRCGGCAGLCPRACEVARALAAQAAIARRG